MSGAESDPVLGRAIDELKRLPAVDAAAMDRVIAAAAIARVTPADEPVHEAPSDTRRWSRAWRIAATVAMASAAGVAGFMVRGGASTSAPPTVAAHEELPAATPTSVQRVADVAGIAKPVLRQFVFHSAHANRVSVVGDFNQWDASSAPMVRAGDGTLWSVLVPMLPGRHVYAFMVDDSVLTLDPTAPTARDPDFGTQASVALVGRP